MTDKSRNVVLWSSVALGSLILYTLYQSSKKPTKLDKKNDKKHKILLRKRLINGMDLIDAYLRLNFGKLVPKLILYKIHDYYFNGFPYKIYNSRFKYSKDIGITQVIVNGYANFYMDMNGELYVNGTSKQSMGINKCDINLKRRVIKHRFFNGINKPSVISHGTDNMHCFIYTINGKLYGFGRNYGKIISSTEETRIMTPVSIKYNFDSNIIQIECGSLHSLFLTSNGTVYGSGNNNRQQLTKNYISNNDYGICKLYNNIIRIGCCWDASYLLTNDNILLTVGSNREFQLGRRTNNYKNGVIFTKIDANIKITLFDCGRHHVGCISTEKQLYLFGHNLLGQLGRVPPQLGQQMDKIYHVKGKLGITCIDIKCGDSHTIAKTIDNEYYSFGDNRKNQLCIEPQTYIRTYISRPALIDIQYIKKLTQSNENIIDIIPGNCVTYILQTRN